MRFGSALFAIKGVGKTISRAGEATEKKQDRKIAPLRLLLYFISIRGEEHDHFAPSTDAHVCYKS